MAWTAPKTWTTNEVLFASDLNTYLTANLDTSAPALAEYENSYFVSSGENSVAERRMGYDEVNANESTSSTTFTDLDTVGPRVTVTTGSGGAVVWLCADLNNANNSALVAIASVEITGAAGGDSNAAADNDRAVYTQNTAQFQNIIFYDGLTPGENTFTMKYSVSGAGTCFFRWRRMMVMPF